MRKRIITLLLLFLVTGVATAQKKIPTPAEVLGFVPGEDRKLASWDQIVDYFQKLDAASDRVVFETLGNTTMGKPFVMATISSPANLARLEELRKIQDQLADPRKLGPLATRDRKAAELIRKGKNVVLITCGIHSTEVGSYLSSTLIAYQLASSTDANVQKILAIEYLAAAQAHEFMDGRQPGRGTGAALAHLRAVVPPLEVDRFMSPDLAAAERTLDVTCPVEA